MKSVAIVHTDFRIYWPSRLAALRDYLADRGVALSVIEIAGLGSPYGFAEAVHSESLSWYCLFDKEVMENIPAAKAVNMVCQKLDELSPDVVVAGAIAFPSGAAALKWTIRNRKPVVIFDDARLDDIPRSCYINWIKKQIYSHVSAMVIPAPSHNPSYRFFGFSSEQLFHGINCIDNKYFSVHGKHGYLNEQEDLFLQGKKYILAVGRQIMIKNWNAAIDAFKLLIKNRMIDDWHLVFIGDGLEHGNLVALSAEYNGRYIHFREFKKQDELRAYYRNAKAVILPSNRETWGLVVNEAMASELPVLVSRGCGCVDTLVQNGVNGYVFNPDDLPGIEKILLKFVGINDTQRREMGQASRRIIEDWGLDRFCRGMWEAISFAHANGTRSGSFVGRRIVSYWNGRYRPI